MEPFDGRHGLGCGCRTPSIARNSTKLLRRDHPRDSVVVCDEEAPPAGAKYLETGAAWLRERTLKVYERARRRGEET